jgi:hypothetical protein
LCHRASAGPRYSVTHPLWIHSSLEREGTCGRGSEAADVARERGLLVRGDAKEKNESMEMEMEMEKIE